MKKKSSIDELLAIMARLRAPNGCPWDREQTHMSIRFHAVEEVYELLDAIEAGDDLEMEEELGDMLLQVVFHCQMAKERGAFDFEKACRHISDKLIRRHPHVFGKAKVRSVDAVWDQWEKIKRAEKAGTRRERFSAFDGIPRHLPALLRTKELMKKARKAGLCDSPSKRSRGSNKREVAKQLFSLAEYAQSRGWSAEELLRAENKRQERILRRREKAASRRTE